MDFGEAIAVIGGVRQKTHFFCMDLPKSDGCFVRVWGNRGLSGRPWGGVKVLKRSLGRRRSTSATPLSPLTLVPRKRVGVVLNSEFEYLCRRGAEGTEGTVAARRRRRGRHPLWQCEPDHSDGPFGGGFALTPRLCHGPPQEEGVIARCREDCRQKFINM